PRRTGSRGPRATAFGPRGRIRLRRGPIRRIRSGMHHLHGRLERLHAKVRETLATEFPDVPLGTLQPVVCMPYPEDDRDLVFFYGEGVAPHADFDYATTRLSDLLQQDGIDTAFARVSRAAYEEHLKTTGQDDEPEQRFLFLAR